MATTININEVVQTDDLIERDRMTRGLVAFSSPIFCLYAGWKIGGWMDGWLHLPGFLSHLGYSAGLGIGTFAALYVLLRSIIKNDATVAFGTINPLASLFKMNPLVFYGPGFHLCYFWEQRSKDNVVNIAEMAVTFKEVKVQCADGEVTMKGSVRLRADIKELAKFIGGAGAVASDVVGLIIAESVEIVSPMPVRQAPGKIGEINEMLAEKFQHGGERQSSKVTDFEKRFGVIVGDVTMEEVLPTKEVQETMGVLAEMEIIYQAVAQKYGKANMAEVWELTKDPKSNVTKEQINRDVTQVMAASGNLQGMELSDQNFNLNITGLGDLNPDVAKAFGTAFAGATQMMGRMGGAGKKQHRSRKENPNQKGTP